MKRCILLLLLLFALFAYPQGGRELAPQVVVQLVVPSQPVVLGTAFQVQYIVNAGEIISANTPRFDSCRIISGPNYYKGSTTIDGKLQPIQNITYTLVPSAVGNLTIGPIQVLLPQGTIQSNGATIYVAAPPPASFTSRSSYTDAALYAPASAQARERMIEENLFIRTVVDKRTVYEGEPLTATFKLYSRLQSSSEAEKSPAFYGFSVVDVLNINESHTAVENTGGKIYNTAILRKVQLYPVQSGKLTIDEMFVSNEVEFFDSIYKTRSFVTRDLVTQPVSITVKPLPPDRPEGFTGAVGKFTIEAALEKGVMRANEQGKLVVRIQGSGNFIQFGLPSVEWPSGMEAFEPVERDALDKNQIPVTGTRTWELPFAVAGPGRYQLPPLRFTYFDPQKGRYSEVITDSLTLEVMEARKRAVLPFTKGSGGVSVVWIAVGLFILAGLFFWFSRKRRVPPMEVAPANPKVMDYRRQIESLNHVSFTDQQVCVELQKILAQWQSEKGSSISTDQQKELQSLSAHCQMMAYGNGHGMTRTQLIQQALDLV